ncbi:hypothetical protein ACWDRR_22785 [Kitasatospora sp. NPDC003701]
MLDRGSHVIDNGRGVGQSVSEVCAVELVVEQEGPGDPLVDEGDDTLARLVTFPQVLITSHQAYFTRTAVGQIIDATARNIDDFEAGRRSENTLVPAADG